MTGLVLDFRKQDGLALQRRRPRQPVAFGLHAYDLGVRMLRYLPDEGAAVGLGHPVFRLDLLFGVDSSLECRELLRRFGALAGSCRLVFLVKTLCIHGISWTGSQERTSWCSRSGSQNGPLICHGFGQLSIKFVSF